MAGKLLCVLRTGALCTSLCRRERTKESKKQRKCLSHSQKRWRFLTAHIKTNKCTFKTDRVISVFFLQQNFITERKPIFRAGIWCRCPAYGQDKTLYMRFISTQWQGDKTALNHGFMKCLLVCLQGSNTALILNQRPRSWQQVQLITCIWVHVRSFSISQQRAQFFKTSQSTSDLRPTPHRTFRCWTQVYKTKTYWAQSSNKVVAFGDKY